MTYCNEKNGELLSPTELKQRLNTSFPEGMTELYGWHLVDEASMYPSLSVGQIAIPDKIVEIDGKWFRTYTVKESAYAVDESAVQQSDAEVFKEKYFVLENALNELAHLVSNLEIERLQKAEKEAE